MKNDMKIIFIAGPYIGDGTVDVVEKNIREAEKYQMALANKEVGFFCPHNHTEHFTTKKGSTSPEQFYYDLDFQFLTRIADAILVMPSWEKSLGTQREVKWAKEKGMKMFFPKDPTDIEDVVKWAKQ
jgi:hypothetical protein